MPESRTPATPIELLLVEDNPADVRLIQETFRDGKLHIEISVAEDGLDGLAYLRREGKHANATRPDLVLLDLSLPRKGGLEVLSEIKRDPDLKRIPIIIITSSEAERDIVSAYENHANCYLNKPVGLDQFVSLVRSLEHFWLSIVKLPPSK